MGANAYVFRDDNIVYGFVEAVLERALDPLVELGKTGWMAVASALMVKASETRRLAGDVIAATIGDGRLDPEALASALGWLLRENAGNLRRATDTLADHQPRVRRARRAGPPARGGIAPRD